MKIIQLMMDLAQMILDMGILGFVAKLLYDIFIKDERTPHSKYEELGRI